MSHNVICYVIDPYTPPPLLSHQAVAKDLLPTAPADASMEPWWTVGLVNLTQVKRGGRGGEGLL